MVVETVRELLNWRRDSASASSWFSPAKVAGRGRRRRRRRRGAAWAAMKGLGKCMGRDWTWVLVGVQEKGGREEEGDGEERWWEIKFRVVKD
ncbi:hypothetical protein DsansV1_C02g0013581 [Dioscorea sansibarensis]